MSEEIFRKKSLDKIKSPENLNDYIRVANPGVWMVLVAVILLLVGACLWGTLGRIETKLPVNVRAENGTVICTVDADKIPSVKVGMTVRVENTEGAITSVDISTGRITAAVDVTDGTYSAYIITESVRPLSFVLN